MNHKKIIYTSLLIGILYLILSFVYLHSGYAFANASRNETNIKIVIEFFCLLPAIAINDIIKKPDEGGLYLTLLLYFVILWIISSGFIYLYKLSKKPYQNKRTV